MNLSLILLKSGEYLISQTEQMDYEPAVHLVNPYSIGGKTKPVLTRWPSYTTDTHILFNSDQLFTMCEPTDAIRDAYLKKIGKTLEDLQPKEPSKIMLQENETLIDETLDEEYEPQYIEEDVL